MKFRLAFPDRDGWEFADNPEDAFYTADEANEAVSAYIDLMNHGVIDSDVPPIIVCSEDGIDWEILK